MRDCNGFTSDILHVATARLNRPDVRNDSGGEQTDELKTRRF